MNDAQVPPEAGEAESAPTRRQTLRLRDAEDMAATRLDMFGDTWLRHPLAGASANAGDGAAPLGAAQATAEPPQPAGATADGAEPQTLDRPPSDAPAPTALPPPDDEPPFAAGAAERQPGPADAEQPSGTEPAAAAPEAGTGAAAVPGTTEAAEDAPQEAAQEWWKGAAVAAGPFGSAFMMPPGSPEQEADLSTGPINERPRFRDELIKPLPSPIVSDAALPEAELSPASELPQDPPFIESPAQLPEEQPPEERVPEDSPEAPTFSGFSEASPYTEEGQAYRETSYLEEGAAYHEPSPIAAEPAPAPPSALLDAAAKIAAEANATAEALDNLKRLLGHTMPRPEPMETTYRPDRASERIAPADPPADSLRLRMQGMQPESPQPFTEDYGPAPLMPLPMAPQRASRRGVYLLGFLTGLALSLMAGGVLYFFIAHIGPS